MVAVADLDLDGVDTVVLVAVVVVLVVVAAGFSAGFAVGPVVGSPAAGVASAGDLSVLSPGTSPASVSPVDGVATSGSTTTCGATAPEVSTTLPAPKTPPAGVTNRADTSDPPAAAHGHVACDHAGDRLVRNIGPVRPGVDGASVHHERLRDVDPALRARRRQGPGTAKRQVAPRLHAAQRDVRIGRMRLRHGVLPDKRQHQVAVGADGLARVAVELQVVGIGLGPAGARHARLAVRRASDDEALRARSIRRPAQQNA